MKLLRNLLTAALLFLATLPAMATTGYVTLSSTSGVLDSTGTVLASGQISFCPVNNGGQAISYQIDGLGQSIDGCVVTTVTSGSFSITLADTYLTNPKNVCFAAHVIAEPSGKPVLGGGYSCMQPASSGQSSWCTDSVCNWNLFTPNEAALAVEQVGPTGPQGPTGATGATGAQGPPGVISTWPPAGLAKSTGSAWASAPTYADIVALFGSGSCSGYLKNDGSCSTSGGMVYPGSGIPVSTGSAWGTSLTKVGTDTGALTAGGSITSGNPICGDANGGGNGGVCKTPIAIPFESSTTSSSQVLWMSQFTVAYTVPSSCSGSKLYALTGATASATFTLYDVTTTTTLCTATFASGGSGGTESATWSGSGGTISAGDIVEWISGSSDVSLLGTGGQILVTR